ncbi:MAG: hypothetical protein AB4062_18100, partial [Crocosphaera sp.]
TPLSNTILGVLAVIVSNLLLFKVTLKTSFVGWLLSGSTAVDPYLMDSADTPLLGPPNPS